MKKFAVFQYDMGMGGIQKSLRNLLMNLDYTELSVDLYLFSRENFWDSDPAAENLFPEAVTVRYIRPGSEILKYIPFDEALSRLAPGITAAFPEGVYYDCAIDFNSYQPECAAGAILAPAARRGEWVHNDIEIKLKNEWKYRVLHFFFKGKFKYFDGFVCVSQGITGPFLRSNRKYMNGDAAVSVIQNYIDTEEIEIKKNEPEQGEELLLNGAFFNLVTIGRLCHQKGYDIMLQELRKAIELRGPLTEADPKKYPPLRLTLIGDGPDRKKLEKQAAALGLLKPGEETVCFAGKRNNPFCIMNRADAFISTARYEGQAMNIMEARAVGLPLYCTKNLEAYVEWLEGCDRIGEAVAGAVRQEHRPDRMEDYNRKIIAAVRDLG